MKAERHPKADRVGGEAADYGRRRTRT